MKNKYNFTIGTDVRNGIKGVILFDVKYDKNMVLAIYPPNWNEYTGTALRERFEIQDQPTDAIISKLVEHIMLYRKLIAYIDKCHKTSSNETFYHNIFDYLEDLEEEEGDSLYGSYEFCSKQEEEEVPKKKGKKASEEENVANKNFSVNDNGVHPTFGDDVFCILTLVGLVVAVFSFILYMEGLIF